MNPPCFHKFHFNIIFPSVPLSSKWSQVLQPNFVWILHLPILVYGEKYKLCSFSCSFLSPVTTSLLDPLHNTYPKLQDRNLCNIHIGYAIAQAVSRLLTAAFWVRA
jgi:hypothetical protein